VDDFNAVVRGGRASGRGLKQPKEQQAPVIRIAAVEAKNILVKITLKMFWLRTPFIGSFEDPFEERKKAVHAGK
jgi:hypothetical protein